VHETLLSSVKVAPAGLGTLSKVQRRPFHRSANAVLNVEGKFDHADSSP
jgi:hypothetical protein